MNYLLSKIFPLFLYPLGLSLIFILFGLLLLLAGYKRISGAAVFAAFIILWISSTSVFADFLSGTLEDDYSPVAIQEIPQADVILVLGGMARGRVPDTDFSDLDDSVDRLIYGRLLYAVGKAPLILLSGGSSPGFVPEAELMADILVDMGVQEKDILLETESRNTYENAINTQKILQEKDFNEIILVTSAYHMKRAAAVFTALGISVISAPTDYQVVQKKSTILDWLPEADALLRTTRIIKEYIGFQVYSMRGWVE